MIARMSHDLRVRDLSSHRNGQFPNGEIRLGPRKSHVFMPTADGSPIRVELDLAVQLDDDQAALIVPSPTLFELGLRPVAGADLITPNRPIRPLFLLLESPREAVALEAGTHLATMAIIGYVTPRYYHDPFLDIGEREADPDLIDFLDPS